MTTKQTYSFSAKDGVPPQVGPFAHATRWGDIVFVTGQMPTSPDTGTLVEGGISEQTRQVFENLSAVLAQFGATLNDALMVRAYLANFNDFAAFNSEYIHWFAEPLPSRTCVGISGLAVEALVEVDLVVGIPSRPVMTNEGA